MTPYYDHDGVTLHNGKVEDVLPEIAGAFDACLCDPPYHLTTGKRGGSGAASENLNHPGGRARITTGFMGKAWDGGDVAFRPETWAEVLRALNPGAPLMVFGGTRTYHRLACAIEDGGFSLSDTLCWLYGQGFPKGKAQLKPAWEPITLAWKKGKRALAIDEGRIAVEDEDYARNCAGDRGHDQNRTRAMDFTQTAGHASAIGRWPANVILDEDAAAELDEQSGVSTGDGRERTFRRTQQTTGWSGGSSPMEVAGVDRGDSGGASRFFYCAKASRSERGEGNTHPTVKPLKLLEYLARLILPPKRDTPRRLLVPFSGSGSEILGALAAGWDEVVGIEMNPEYCEMAVSRFKAVPNLEAMPLFEHARIEQLDLIPKPEPA